MGTSNDFGIISVSLILLHWKRNLKQFSTSTFGFVENKSKYLQLKFTATDSVNNKNPPFHPSG